MIKMGVMEVIRMEEVRPVAGGLGGWGPVGCVRNRARLEAERNDLDTSSVCPRGAKDARKSLP